MDELNIAGGQPSAELPPESKPGQAEASAAPLPAVDSAPAEVAPAVDSAPAEVAPPAEPALPVEPVPPEPPAPAVAPPAVEELEIAVAETPPAEPPAVAPPAEPPTPVEEPKSEKMDWYILKVQSNREESIREGLLRRVAIAGLGYYFGDVIVPTEKVTEFKGGKKKITKRKLYPGYLVVHMEINDDTWFLVRETPGIGDFTGAAGRPSPMLPHEVARIVAKQEEKSEKTPKLKIAFREGERVKINEGTFENFEGEVDSIDETNGRVTVMINIFGRSTPVELEYWQIEAL